MARGPRPQLMQQGPHQIQDVMQILGSRDLPSESSDSSKAIQINSAAGAAASATSALLARLSDAIGMGTKADGPLVRGSTQGDEDELARERTSSNVLPGVIAALGNRVQTKSNELARYFGVPMTETFLDDYNCALRKRVLLQGRMYIFDHYVCFSSFVFGFAKKVVIPLEHVFSVRKKTHLRFPNSIKIEFTNSNNTVESYFFTSFLSREDAFQLISNCVKQSRSHLSNGDVDFGNGSSTSPGGLMLGSMPPISSGHTDVPAVGVRAIESMPAGIPRQVTNADDDSDNDEGEPCEDAVWCTVTSGHVPHLHKEAKVVIQAVLEGTPHELFDLLLADKSHMLEDFLESQGNRRINLTGWKLDAQLGHVRSMQFVSPIKGAFSRWGVPTTQCFQSHRFRRFAGDHLVFETSQTMTEIPYGDCFTVDTRWDIKPMQDHNPLKSVSAPAATDNLKRADSPFNQESADDDMSDITLPQMQMTISVRVPFSQRCMFKTMIEGGSVKGVKEQYTVLVEQLRQALVDLERDNKAANSAVQLGSPGAGSGIIKRHSNQGLPTISSKGNLSQADGAPLSRGGSTNARTFNHTIHARPSPSIFNRNASTFTVETTGNSVLSSFRIWRAWPSLRERSSFFNLTSFLPRSILPPAVQDASTEVSQIRESVSLPPPAPDPLTPGQMFQMLLSLLVLGIQVLILVATWRMVARSTTYATQHVASAPALATTPSALHTGELGAAHGAHGSGFGSFDGGFVGETAAIEVFMALGKDIWSRRAELLGQELALLKQHMQAVEDQLALAQAYGTQG